VAIASTGEIARYLSNSMRVFRTLADVEGYQNEIRKRSEHLYGISLIKNSRRALFVEYDRFVRDQLVEIEIATQKHSKDLHKLILILLAIDEKIEARMPLPEEAGTTLATIC
jgi:hypothetical protein